MEADEKLGKGIKFRQLFATGFGAIIGVGWMVMAGDWILTAGSLGAILAFIVGGIAILFIGLVYGELGGMYPQSGADVVYNYSAFGTPAAFAAGWILALIYLAICAFLSSATAWVLGILFDLPEGLILYSVLGHGVSQLDIAVAVVGTFVFAIVNLFGGGSMATLQEWLTWVLVAIWLVFVAAAVAGGDPQNLEPLFSGKSRADHWNGFFALLAVIPVWYGGFSLLPQALGEVASMENIAKFGRVLTSVIAATGLFYIGVIVATAFALQRTDIAGAELPVAAALQAIAPTTFLRDLVLVAGLIGILTSWNACFYAGTRVLFSLGRARIIYPGFARVQGRVAAPTSAIFFVAVFSFAGSLAGQNSIGPFIGLIGLGYAMLYLAASMALAVLRKKRPEMERPFKMPGHPAISIIAGLLSVAFIVASVMSIWTARHGAMPVEFVVGAIWLAVGGLVWFASGKSRMECREEERERLIHLR